ncbi:MAG: hypothetical protein ABFD65_02415 [Candidatus Polarisedimenticolia bacterium]
MKTKTQTQRGRNRAAGEARRQIAARDAYEAAWRYYREARARNTDDEEIRAARRICDAAFDEYQIAIGRKAA